MITKTPTNNRAYAKGTSFSNAARDCWRAVLKHPEKMPKVLLPAYVGVTDREGSGIFDPITVLNLSYGFYALNEDLTINVDEILRALKKDDFDIILVVHYFGLKIQNIDKIVSICRDNGLLVVEDCAHLYNINQYHLSDAGTYGDFAFYSLHKYFPFKDGGMLVKNNDELTMPEITPIPTVNLGNKLLRYDVQAISQKRIENFKTYQKFMTSISGIKPLRYFNQGDIPHNYPIVIENDLREPLYFWLLENDIPLIALYYKLIDPILNDGNFRETQRLSNNILNLPVHQDIEKVDIIKIVKFLEKGIKELLK